MAESDQHQQQSAGIDHSGIEALAKALRMSFNLLVIGLVSAVFFFLWKSLFVVEPNEQGIILRTGKILSKNGKQVLDNGTHFSYPYPIDQQIVVPSKRTQMLSVEDFWYKDGEPQDVLIPGRDGYNLTGDMNILHSNWTLHYNIVDPLAYTFRFSDAEARGRYLRAVLLGAVTHAVTALPIDTAWHNKDERLRELVRQTLNRRIEEVGLGIAIDRLELQLVPPRQVENQFKSVTQAEEKRRKLVSEAEGGAQRTISKAKVTAAQIIANSNTGKARKVAAVSADAEVFEKLYVQYKRNPQVFSRLYFEERMQDILSNLDEKYIIDRRRQREIRLQLSSEKKKKGADGTGN